MARTTESRNDEIWIAVDLDEPIVEPSEEMLTIAPYCDVDFNSPNPWGIPDWRDPSAYEYLRNMHWLEWSWEFTRRSEDYRVLWLEMQGKRQRSGDPAVIFDETFEDMSVKLANAKLMGPQFDCKNEEVATHLGDWRAKPGDTTLFPILACDDESLADWLGSVRKSGHVLARIDPWRPLGPQFEHISAVVTDWKDDEASRLFLLGEEDRVRPTVKQRLRTEKYPMYLRILDARDSRSPHPASWGEIVKALKDENLPISINRDSLRQLHKQAIRVQKRFAGQPEDDEI